DAGHLAARRERPLRLVLVLVLDDQHVGEVDAAGLHADHRVARLSFRRGQLAQFQRLGAPDRLAQHSLHRVSPLVSLRPRTLAQRASVRKAASEQSFDRYVGVASATAESAKAMPEY